MGRRLTRIFNTVFSKNPRKPAFMGVQNGFGWVSPTGC